MLRMTGVRKWVVGFTIFALSGQALEACSRAVYFGKEGRVVTGRTMDWREDMQTNLWIFPRGMERDGAVLGKKLKWVSQYGSVIASVYEGGTSDGMNEKGLVVNMLYLSESIYPEVDDRPGLSVAAWAQYVLDSFASVTEAVEELKKDEIRLVSIAAPDGSKGTVHLSLSDSTGDSAVIECLDGKITIHHGREYQVMTNSPAYDKQLALNAYWQSIGGTVMLPGTNRAADRFARASFYINACEQTADQREAVAATLSVMRNVSVPRGISTPDQPNIASTLWRSVSDHKDLVYFFERTNDPSLLWVDLKEIDFKAGTGTRKLQLDGKKDVGGNQTQNFVAAEPFRFLE